MTHEALVSPHRERLRELLKYSPPGKYLYAAAADEIENLRLLVSLLTSQLREANQEPVISPQSPSRLENIETSDTES